MLWSVIIPTKGPPPYLQQALGSVQGQLGNGEILIQINPSDTHYPPDWLRPHSGYVWEMNESDLGCYGSINQALKRAKGEWVHVLHDDDWVLPGFYDSLGEVIRGPILGRTHGVVSCGYKNFYQECGTYDEPGWLHTPPRPPEFSDWLSTRLTYGNPFQVPAVVFHRDVFMTVGNFREDMPYAGDWEFYARVLTKFDWFHLSRDLARYRVYKGQRCWDMLRDGRARKDHDLVCSLASKYFHERTGRDVFGAISTLGC